MAERSIAEKRPRSLRLYTGSRWVRGHIISRHRRLIDVLNQEYHDTLRLKGVTTGGYRDADSDSQPTAEVLINMSAIDFVVPLDDEPGAAADPFLRVEKRRLRTRLAVGPYDIEGHAFVLGIAVVSLDLLTQGDRFLAMVDAVVTRADDPSFKLEFDLALVNTANLEYGAFVP